MTHKSQDFQLLKDITKHQELCIFKNIKIFKLVKTKRARYTCRKLLEEKNHTDTDTDT